MFRAGKENALPKPGQGASAQGGTGSHAFRAFRTFSCPASPRRYARPLCKTRRTAPPLRPPGKSPEAHRKPCAAKLRQQAGEAGRPPPPFRYQEKRRLTRRRLCPPPFLLKRRTPFPAPMFLKHGVLIPPHVPRRAGKARKPPRLLPPLRQHAPACRYARGWQKKQKAFRPGLPGNTACGFSPAGERPAEACRPSLPQDAATPPGLPSAAAASPGLRKSTARSAREPTECYRVRKSGA